jgi:hypothetical protein
MFAPYHLPRKCSSLWLPSSRRARPHRSCLPGSSGSLHSQMSRCFSYLVFMDFLRCRNRNLRVEVKQRPSASCQLLKESDTRVDVLGRCRTRTDSANTFPPGVQVPSPKPALMSVKQTPPTKTIPPQTTQPLATERSTTAPIRHTLATIPTNRWASRGVALSPTGDSTRTPAEWEFPHR